MDGRDREKEEHRERERKRLCARERERKRELPPSTPPSYTRPCRVRHASSRYSWREAAEAAAMRERGEARRGDVRRGKARRGEARQEPILPLESERVSERTTTPRRRGRGGPSQRSFSLASRARCESPRQAPLLRRASRPEGAHGVRRGRGRGRGDERVGGGERTGGGGKGERRCSRTHMSVV